MKNSSGGFVDTLLFVGYFLGLNFGAGVRISNLSDASQAGVENCFFERSMCT